MVKNKPKKLEYKKTIVSLVKNSLLHYDMLMSLQAQVMCLEAKIKLLEGDL